MVDEQNPAGVRAQTQTSRAVGTLIRANLCQAAMGPQDVPSLNAHAAGKHTCEQTRRQQQSPVEPARIPPISRYEAIPVSRIARQLLLILAPGHQTMVHWQSHVHHNRHDSLLSLYSLSCTPVPNT